MPPADSRHADRTFADELWSHDGMVSQQAWTTAEKVVRSANILKADVAYDCHRHAIRQGDPCREQLINDEEEQGI